LILSIRRSTSRSALFARAFVLPNFLEASAAAFFVRTIWPRAFPRQTAILLQRPWIKNGIFCRLRIENAWFSPGNAADRKWS
jgi:hypothetical protein